MPTYAREEPKMPSKKTKVEPKERHRIGPHGEKRPFSSVSNAVRGDGDRDWTAPRGVRGRIGWTPCQARGRLERRSSPLPILG